MHSCGATPVLGRICPGAVTCPQTGKAIVLDGAGATSNLAGAAWRESSLDDGAEAAPQAIFGPHIQRRELIGGYSTTDRAGWALSDTELLQKPKPEPVRRLEVFTGAGRRRAWTAEQKAQILAESYESGEKGSAVARRMG